MKAGFQIILMLLTFILIHLLMMLYALVLFILSIITYLLPSKRLRLNTKKKLFLIYRSFCNICFLLLNLSFTINIYSDSSMPPLSRDSTYIMISNHQSWFDALIILACLQSKASFIKFMMKKELLWQLPLASWVCYMNNFPMIKRQKNSKSLRHDAKAIDAACQSMCSSPSTLMMFLEGSRFTHQKKNASQTTFDYLLPPKQRGLALCIESIDEHLSGIIDVTIIYNSRKVSMKDILLGKIQHIDLHYSLIPVNQICRKDPLNPASHQAAFKSWLDAIWHKKDKLMREHNRQ